MMKMLFSALLFVSITACREQGKAPAGSPPAPAPEAGKAPAGPSPSSDPAPSAPTTPAPSSAPDLKAEQPIAPAPADPPAATKIPEIPVIPAAPVTPAAPVKPVEAPKPAPPQYVVGQSMDYSERETIRNRNGLNFIPIIKSADFTIYARTWEETVSENTRIPVIKVPKGRSIDDEIARMDVSFMANGGAAGYRRHFVRRGVELRDGSLLIVSVNSSNMGYNTQHDHYRQTFVIKTTPDLKVVSSFGKDGVIALESLGTNMNYRFVRKIVEEPNGDLFLFEKRTLREGLGYLEAPDECYKIKFNKQGKIDLKHGKKGYLALPSCTGI